jgi:hypothetical protein
VGLRGHFSDIGTGKYDVGRDLEKARNTNTRKFVCVCESHQELNVGEHGDPERMRSLQDLLDIENIEELTTHVRVERYQLKNSFHFVLHSLGHRVHKSSVDWGNACV